MPTDQIVLISLLLNGIAVLLVVWLVYKGDRAVNEFQPYIKDVEKTRHDLAQKGNEIIDQATRTADEITKRAQEYYQSHLKTSEHLKADLEKMLRQSLENSLNETA